MYCLFHARVQDLRTIHVGMACCLCPLSRNCSSFYAGKPGLTISKVVSWNKIRLGLKIIKLFNELKISIKLHLKHREEWGGNSCKLLEGYQCKMFTLWADLSIPLSPCLWLIFYLSTSTCSKDIELGVKLVRDMVLPFVACDHGLSLFPLGGGKLVPSSL